MARKYLILKMSRYEDRLKNRVLDIQDELDIERDRKQAKKRNDRELRAFKKLPPQAENDFWCQDCMVDFKVPSYKVWSDTYQIGSWISFCPWCSRHVFRHITDKTTDPYYEMSDRIRTMRSEGEADMLRPDQYGFKTLYGDPYEKYWQNAEAMRRQMLNEKYMTAGLHGEIAQPSERETLQELFDKDGYD